MPFSRHSSNLLSIIFFFRNFSLSVMRVCTGCDALEGTSENFMKPSQLLVMPSPPSLVAFPKLADEEAEASSDLDPKPNKLEMPDMILESLFLGADGTCPAVELDKLLSSVSKLSKSPKSMDCPLDPLPPPPPPPLIFLVFINISIPKLLFELPKSSSEILRVVDSKLSMLRFISSIILYSNNLYF